MDDANADQSLTCTACKKHISIHQIDDYNKPCDVCRHLSANMCRMTIAIDSIHTKPSEVKWGVQTSEVNLACFFLVLW